MQPYAHVANPLFIETQTKGGNNEGLYLIILIIMPHVIGLKVACL